MSKTGKMLSESLPLISLAEYKLICVGNYHDSNRNLKADKHKRVVEN